MRRGTELFASSLQEQCGRRKETRFVPAKCSQLMALSCATIITMTNRDEQLQERLGCKFQNPELLERALTHSSAIPELRAADPDSSPENNEQLEFLGDAVLDLLASEY